MRVLTHHRVARRIALVLAVAPVLIACGVILDVADDPVSPPDRVDGGQGESAIGQESGPLDPDATAGDSGGDACATAAACSPQRLTTLSGGVIRLVVVGNSLYAAHTSSAGERVVSLASGAPGPVLDLDPQAQVPNLFGASSNIAVDMNGAVYWGTANGLRRHDVGAGADASTDAGVTPFSDLGSPVSGVRIADGRLHFTVNTPTGGLNGGYIGSCALPGCTGVQSAVTVAYPLDVIASGSSRWWLGERATGSPS